MCWCDKVFILSMLTGVLCNFLGRRYGNDRFVFIGDGLGWASGAV
jgi:hypothetical protein